MSHASHYAKAGISWYNNFVTAELTEIQRHPSGNNNPYGTGNTAESPIIAVGEGWAYFIGLFLANQKYNIEPGTVRGCSNFILQEGGVRDWAGITLESFDPRLSTDPFRWIPAGLMEDMRDANNEPTSPVIDGVSNFTIQQLFNPLQSDVSTIPAYRARLIQQNPNNQTAQITALFGQYNY